ncbi:MAG TPA: PQQ-dependent sugar dehydrogenase [Burkholderiales bacterium]|nr:PQQ-dependent sugar dehydrogenase [Burkholderiales bacterium]
MPAFSQPVAMLQSPGDDSRWFVLEQAGKVRKFSNVSSASAAADFLDITGRVTSGGETGLLGMAFHPHFPADPRVYISYTQTDSTLGLVSRISEFSSPDAGATLDSGSEQIILTVQQPESNHNGGNIAFGPDGFLYIGFGDGGGGNDQHGTTGNGQLLTTLLGKILRIDIDGPAPYGIPATNPFSGHALCGANGSGPASCPEIFAFGFRNPWRWSFDRQNGELWVGDVGQSAMEEIDRVTRGGNYGWRCFEGTLATGMTCGTTAGFLAPVAAYGRSVGATVIGGYVYRGSAIPALAGRYVFGDFVTGRIFQIASSAQPTVTVSGGLSTGLGISAFAQDRNGELYVVSYSGQLYRISG